MNNQQAKNKSAVKRSAYRATTQYAKPSKDKHVRILVLQSFNRDGSVEEIIKALVKRMEKQNWAVVIKSLMIFHRCFRDGDPAFIEAMKPRSNLVFALRTFSSLAPPNHLFTVFVKKYAKYLEEKVSVLRLLGYQFEKNQDAVKNLKGQAVYKVIPKLQSQLNALLNCKLKAQHAGAHTLINHALILLCQDSLVLYSLLNEQVVKLVDVYWKMNRKDATRTLNIYKLFTKETDALIGLYEIAKQFIRQLPSVNKAETSIIDQMEKYLDSIGGALDSDDEGNGKKKGKKNRGRDDDSDDSNNEMLNTRAGNEQYDERDYGGGGDDDDDEEESSGSEDDAPDYFKDFFAGMPSMQNNPFGQQPQAPPQNFYSSQNNNAMVAQPQPSPFGQSPFGSQPAASPFASQPRPAAAFGSQAGSPFGAPAPSPFAAPAPSPFGAPSPSPFGAPAQASNPFASSAPQPNPFASSSAASNPFGVGGGSMVLASHQPSPFAAQPQANPFGQSAFGGGSTYGAPSPFAPQQPANPFATPQSTFASNPGYGQPQQQAANPFL